MRNGQMGAVTLWFGHMRFEGRSVVGPVRSGPKVELS
jgi:hypothetical protein